MKRFLKQYVVPVALSALLTSALFFLVHGIPLWGVPDAADVVSVEITDTILSPKARVLATPRDVEMAVNMLGFLNYTLGAADTEAPFLRFVYHLKDGSALSLEVSDKTVYWRGRAHAVKDDGANTFASIAQGYFFFDLVAPGSAEN